MGTLFPDAAEYPDHRSMPSLTSELGKRATVSAAIVAVLAPLCPVQDDEHPHEHVPHREFVETQPPTVTWIASGSSSSSDDVPFDWMNNSSLDAANVVIQRHHAQRAAFVTAIALTPSSLTGSYATT